MIGLTGTDSSRDMERSQEGGGLVPREPKNAKGFRTDSEGPCKTLNSGIYRVYDIGLIIYPEPYSIYLRGL